MTHDFKKGDYVILPDGKTGTIRSIMLCIVEVEINKHIKYVDIRTLKHYEREDRAGESVAELETLIQAPYVGKWNSYLRELDLPEMAMRIQNNRKQEASADYIKLMADGCDPAPESSGWVSGKASFRSFSKIPVSDPADDGPEVEILRRKP